MKSPEVCCAESRDYDATASLARLSMGRPRGVFLDEEAMRPWVERDEADRYVKETPLRIQVAEASCKPPFPRRAASHSFNDRPLGTDRIASRGAGRTPLPRARPSALENQESR